jgi:hypothetical protein
MNFCIKIKSTKKIEALNHIFCIIFKVRGPKCIFPETSGTPNMDGAFFISVSIILIPPLTKKSEALN